MESKVNAVNRPIRTESQVATHQFRVLIPGPTIPSSPLARSGPARRKEYANAGMMKDTVMTVIEIKLHFTKAYDMLEYWLAADYNE